MAEGFGPRFKRLREKVDAWGKEYDEHRAADRAFLERDKARSEKARAEWREHQARLKQRVKVFGRSGAKAEGRPTRGNGNGQTVTPVVKPESNQTQLSNPESKPTPTVPNPEPKQQKEEEYDAYGMPKHAFHPVVKSAGIATTSLAPSAVVRGVRADSAARHTYRTVAHQMMQSAKIKGGKNAGKVVGSVWNTLNRGAKHAVYNSAKPVADATAKQAALVQGLKAAGRPVSKALKFAAGPVPTALFDVITDATRLGDGTIEGFKREQAERAERKRREAEYNQHVRDRRKRRVKDSSKSDFDMRQTMKRLYG